MVSAWNQLPFFWDRYGAHYFFIWHPNTSIATPLENPPLGPLDTALLTQLEASLPTMNQQLTDSLARVRNAPTPAPPDPGSRRFLRVKVDSGTDTDSDGSPDWAEFQIAARAAAALLVSGPAPAAPATPPATGDPFNADTNNDGIPDGQQLDFDLDLTADAYDQDLADSTATYPFGPEPRYALFPSPPARSRSTPTSPPSRSTTRAASSISPALGAAGPGRRSSCRRAPLETSPAPTASMTTT